MPSLPTEIPSFMTWAWGKVILEKGLSKKKKKERQSIPLPFTKKKQFVSVMMEKKASQSETFIPLLVNKDTQINPYWTL